MLSSVARHQWSLLPVITRGAPLLYQRCGLATGPSKVVELLSDEEYQSALKDLTATKSAAIIDFTAKWCGPCKMIAPIYEKLSSENPDIRFYKIDIDQPALGYAVREQAITAVPTFLGFKAGRAVGAFSGADRGELQRMVQQLKGGSSEAGAM